MHPSLAAALLASFVTSLVATPIARRLGAAAGLLDHPERRKLQETPVPRTGGIAVLAGLLAGMAVLLTSAAGVSIPMNPEFIAILIGGIIVHLTGVLDDLLNLPALGKLFAQMLAVSVVVSQGVVIEQFTVPGVGTVEFGAFAIPLTAFFLLGFVNSLNLVDGLDGLASGIAAIAALMLAINGFLEGNALLAGLSVVLLGSTLGFLPFNFSKRHKTFLGDSGSMLLGWMVGIIAITGVRSGTESTAMFVALGAAFIPILDTATTILRRLRRRVGVFSPDAMHVHHRFIRFGLSPGRTVLTIHAMTLFTAGLCLATFHAETRLLFIASTLAGFLVVLEIQSQRRRNFIEESTSFRDVVLYLLGTQEGEGPRLGGELPMADVIANMAQAAQEPSAADAHEPATVGAGRSAAAATSTAAYQPLAPGDLPPITSHTRRGD